MGGGLRGAARSRPWGAAAGTNPVIREDPDFRKVRRGHGATRVLADRPGPSGPQGRPGSARGRWAYAIHREMQDDGGGTLRVSPPSSWNGAQTQYRLDRAPRRSPAARRKVAIIGPKALPLNPSSRLWRQSPPFAAAARQRQSKRYCAQTAWRQADGRPARPSAGSAEDGALIVGKSNVRAGDGARSTPPGPWCPAAFRAPLELHRADFVPTAGRHPVAPAPLPPSEVSGAGHTVGPAPGGHRARRRFQSIGP